MNLKSYYDQDGKLIIRPYRMKDLAAIYNVSGATIRRWMIDVVPGVVRKQGKYFSIYEVTTIVEALGIPYKIN